MFVFSLLFVFFKQKTAYEMRISDWSSDVCSSDLGARWTAPTALSGKVSAQKVAASSAVPSNQRQIVFLGIIFILRSWLIAAGQGTDFRALPLCGESNGWGGHAKACLLRSRRTMGCGIYMRRASPFNRTPRCRNAPIAAVLPASSIHQHSNVPKFTPTL